MLLGVAAFTGMASFIYEVVWIRMLSLVLGASTHSFELMLSAFITGLALGGLWIVDALGLPLWQGFAPNSGFMPLIYGVLLLALSGGAAVRLILQDKKEGEQVETEPIGKPLLLLARNARALSTALAS